MCYEKQQSCVRGEMLWDASRGAGGESYCRGGAGGGGTQGIRTGARPSLAVPCSSGLCAMGGGGATTLQADLMAAGGGRGMSCPHPLCQLVPTRSALGHLCVFRWLLLLLTCQPPPHLASKTGIRKGFSGHRQTPPPPPWPSRLPFFSAQTLHSI